MTTIAIPEKPFQEAHQMFVDYYEHYEGWPHIPFRSFSHPAFVMTELCYKYSAYQQAHKALQLHKWDGWIEDNPLMIFRATERACDPKLTTNLFILRHGVEHSPLAPFAQAQSEAAQVELAHQLYELFLGGSSDPEALGPRFDRFVEFLAHRGYRRRWTLMSYLLFLIDIERYFPIRARYMDKVMEFYGLSLRLSHHIQWQYLYELLQIFDALRQKLRPYRPSTNLDIQSYCYIIGALLKRRDEEGIDIP